MMKRILCMLLGCLLLAGCAAAEEAGQEEAKHSALNLLTEVYGYTVEEADAFEMEVTEDFDVWQVRFWPAAHPDWVYTAQFNRENGQFRHSATPFKGQETSPYYPGESTVRDGLRVAREKGWFTRWEEADRRELLSWMVEAGLNPDADLQRGLSTGSISAGNALHAYFVHSYGEVAEWTDALKSWHDEELSSYSLSVEAQIMPADGVVRYEPKGEGSSQAVRVTQFLKEQPAELGEVLSHPKLEGWTLLCGAYYEMEQDDEWTNEMGLIAFAKGEERLLVQMGRETGTEPWKLYPVGEQALKKGQDVYITCDPLNHLFSIVYPLSKTAEERFGVRCYLSRSGSYDAMDCRLDAYSRTDSAAGEGIRIRSASDGFEVTITHKDGEVEKERVEKYIHGRFDLIDADAFPTTLEALKNLPDIEAPAGYGVTSGPHLRAQTSSRSKDLGTYEPGTLVEILGEEDGDPYNWYRVRVGSMEGYMCSVYVDYEGSVCAMEPLTQYGTLRVAETLETVKLKSGVGWFDKTVAELPAGARMHVLAERGGWLHVMIPQGEIGWMMDVNGMDGYIRKTEVRMGLNALQLDWME